jgi:hypothetical protein
MKIHVKNIDVEHERLSYLLCELQKPFVTNKDTHTFYDCDELFEIQLERIRQHFDSEGKTIMITKGGL